MANRVQSYFAVKRTITPINRRVEFESESGHTFIFRYRSCDLPEALRMPGQMVVASKGRLSWADAMICCEMMRDQQKPLIDDCL